MFQYNYARYTSRGGSKPYLGGFQPPQNYITDQASAASSRKFFILTCFVLSF